jgi:two-component system, NtrC family, sensor histidine kinase KinB
MTVAKASTGQPMNLNRKVLIGLMPLLLIIVAVGIYGAFLFTKLGSAIDVILRENYISVIASQNMKESAERMDSGLLFMLGGEEAKGLDLFKQNLPVFKKNCDLEFQNITLPGERKLADTILSLHLEYVGLANRFFALKPGDPARRTLYFNELLPKFTAVKETGNKIQIINQQNMVDANNAAREQSRHSSQLMIVAIVGSFLVAVSISYVLARSLTKPIQALTESAQQLGEGNLDQVVTVDTQDEVGKLADAFNKMAAKLRAYRQSTTEKILQAQQTTEAALRAFPDPILVYSPDRSIRLKNAAAERLLQSLGGELSTIEPLSAYIDTVLRGGADFLPTSFDKSIPLSLPGGEKHFLPRILTMRDETEKILGVVVVLQDVTRFRVADDIKTNLIATVSHELKTPLTSMQMAVYLLLEEKVGPLTPKQLDLLIAARNNSDRLLQLIEDMLDLARFEGGAALTDKKTVSPAQLVEESLSKERELLNERGFTLEVKIEPDLPSISVSPSRVGQVFANLISNAMKYSPMRGKITLSAALSPNQRGFVQFSVKDEGIGIQEKDQHRIFEKFYRVSDNDQSGAGLGLAIAREIVIAHGGVIGVTSQIGEGSEFYFTLPQASTLS